MCIYWSHSGFSSIENQLELDAGMSQAGAIDILGLRGKDDLEQNFRGEGNKNRIRIVHY